MPDFAELFANNPLLFVYLFTGVLVLFLIGFIISKIATNNKKKKLREQNNMAELVFDETIRAASQFVTDLQFMGYKIYSVNNAAPVIAGKSIFVPAGSCKIELEYIDTDYASRRRSVTTIYEKQSLEFKTKRDTQYRIAFDKNSGRFVYKQN
ncbi:MAG: hypothetical protein LBH86_07155 [Oscillospiraceae bacterium]|jgi:hypothetical protein|nr:hypothetical protein [Oscillospiraceae bacterium]